MDRDCRTLKHMYMPRTWATTEGNRTGAWRFLRPEYEEKTAPCSARCPVGEDIPRIEMLITQGAFKEAWETILMENPLPGVCGRVCFHPCEGRCNRREFDSPIAVHTLERFLADTAARNDTKATLPMVSPLGKRIAVIGSGPAGLSVAWFLTVLGHRCEVFEAMPEAGGLLRWGIPEYRLPLGELRREIGRIESAGVRITTGRKVTQDDLASIRQAYDAVFVGCGLGRERPLNVPGEKGPAVEEGLVFLKRVRNGERPDVSGVSIVIGGGNTAVDVARTIVRLSGRVVIVYRRRREDMPAFAEEVNAALEEGVEIKELLAPLRIEPREEEVVAVFQGMRIDGTEADGRGRIVSDGRDPLEMCVSRVIIAAGAEAEEPWYLPPQGKEGLICLSHCVIDVSEAGVPVAYGGDTANSELNVTTAIASGKEAAVALDILFRFSNVAAVPSLMERCRVGDGDALSMEIYLDGARKGRKKHVVAYSEINTDYFQFETRVVQPRLLPEERRSTFDEIEMKISAQTAMREAGRCFNCGICNGCDNCWLFCPDVSVHRDRQRGDRRIDYAYCKGCGLCVVECPRNAMSLYEEGTDEEGH